MDSSSEKNALLTIGRFVIINGLYSYIYTLIYGFSVPFYIKSVMAYAKRKKRTRVQSWMFLIATMTFLSATLNEGILLAYFGLWVHLIFGEDQKLPLPERLISAQSMSYGVGIAYETITTMHMIINDTIITWRAFVILRDRRWPLMFIPSIQLLAFIAMSCVLLLVQILDHKMFGTRLIGRLNQSRLILSLGTNVAATSIISYVYWFHRKVMITGLGNHTHTQVERVLILLVESGMVLCIFQVANAILGSIPKYWYGENTGAYISVIFLAVNYSFAAIYPTVVFVLVHTKFGPDETGWSEASLHGGQELVPERLRFSSPNNSTRTISGSLGISET